MKRIFAHNLIFGGHHYINHVVEYDRESGHTAIFPFTEEIHSTRFFPGSVEVSVENGDLSVSRPDIPLLRFAPFVKETVWGGGAIARLKGESSSAPRCVGESWEVSALPGRESRVAGGPLDGLTLPQLTDRYGPALTGHAVYARHGSDFPLIVKFLDAADNLSLQVHPSDVTAARSGAGRGKNEMWYVVDARPGAKVYAGFSEPLSPLLFDRAVGSAAVIDAVACYPSHKDAVFYIPAGQLHCLGAGNLVLEIQDSSDISYRVYDFGRDGEGAGRPLHIAEARDAIDYSPGHDATVNPGISSGNIEHLVSAPCFRAERIRVSGKSEHDISAIDSFIILTCTEGCATVADERGNALTLEAGATAMAPAVACRLTMSGDATLIAVRSPY